MNKNSKSHRKDIYKFIKEYTNDSFERRDQTYIYLILNDGLLLEHWEDGCLVEYILHPFLNQFLEVFKMAGNVMIVYSSLHEKIPDLISKLPNGEGVNFVLKPDL